MSNSFVTHDFSANEKRYIQCLKISCAHNIAHLNRGIICYNKFEKFYGVFYRNPLLIETIVVLLRKQKFAGDIFVFQI